MSSGAPAYGRISRFFGVSGGFAPHEQGAEPCARKSTAVARIASSLAKVTASSLTRDPENRDRFDFHEQVWPAELRLNACRRRQRIEPLLLVEGGPFFVERR